LAEKENWANRLKYKKMKNKFFESHAKWRISSEMNIDEVRAASSARLNLVRAPCPPSFDS
jgi:hypothetical protein